MPQPKRASIWEDGGAFLAARVLGNNGNYITQSAISSITYLVYDITAGAEVATGSLTVSSVVFDSLQTDGRWTEDDTGYNFGVAVSASWFSIADHTYRVEYKFTPSSGQVFWVVFELPASAIYTS